MYKYELDRVMVSEVLKTKLDVEKPVPSLFLFVLTGELERIGNAFLMGLNSEKQEYQEEEWQV